MTALGDGRPVGDVVAVFVQLPCGHPLTKVSPAGAVRPAFSFGWNDPCWLCQQPVMSVRYLIEPETMTGLQEADPEAAERLVESLLTFQAVA